MRQISGKEQFFGTYAFTKSWRQILPGVINQGLGMTNFKTSASKILSFKTSFTFIDTRSMNLTLNISNIDAGIVYLIFSVIVITRGNPHVELIVLEGTMNSTISTITQLNGTSSRCTFTSTAGDPCYVFFSH